MSARGHVDADMTRLIRELTAADAVLVAAVGGEAAANANPARVLAIVDAALEDPKIAADWIPRNALRLLRDSWAKAGSVPS